MNLKKLKDRIFCCGNNKTGKTYLAKQVLKEVPKHFVFDPLDEYGGFNRYVPSSRYGEDLREEFNFLWETIISKKKDKIDLLIIDEANRLAPNRQPLPYALRELNDFWASHHLDIPFWTICRRPSQIKTDLVELANKLIVFRRTGKNSIARLNAESEELGDMAKSLEGHKFIVVKANREYEVKKSV